MTLLEETIAHIQPPDETASAAVAGQLETSTGEDIGLGALKTLLMKYAAITQTAAPPHPKKCTIICCADHGVAAMKVSAYPPSTTVQMTANYLISRGAVANALSNFAGSELVVADLGIAAPTDHLPGLLPRKIAFGTKNCAVGPAMTREQAIRAVEQVLNWLRRRPRKVSAVSCREKWVLPTRLPPPASPRRFAALPRNWRPGAAPIFPTLVSRSKSRSFGSRFG